MAGSERGGPSAARPDLFVGQPWAVTAHSGSSPAAIEAACAVATDCGAVPVRLTPQEHDTAVGLVSHLPQAVASALAAAVGARASDTALSLVGQGLRDTTRIAASSPELWAEILGRNAAVVAPLVEQTARLLSDLGAGLRGAQPERSAREFIAAGNAGVARLPGKHSGRHELFDVVVVLLTDVPGSLASLLADAHAAGVNVEDIRIEHAPGAAIGVAGLVVRAGTGSALTERLQEQGWAVSVEAAGSPR